MLELYFLFCALLKIVNGELWEQDLSSAMTIGLSTTGYKSVDLKCDVDKFIVNVTLENDFKGIVYTRGSFNNKALPCFKHHDKNSLKENNKLLIPLRIPFHQCGTVMDIDKSRYTNTLVIQHDPDLIMPGDAAFTLDCAFTPEFTVSSSATTESEFKSKITLVDADPAEKSNEEKENFSVFSKSESVSFVPSSVQSKDEL